MKLEKKHILLGITGSIAAFKIPALIRLLQQEGATVRVMATQSALRFVTPLTLETLSGSTLLQDFWQEQYEYFPHLHSSRKADLIVIAPATAESLAKFAHGHAHDLVSATVLGSMIPVLIVPAMNPQMWKNPFVQDNIVKLRRVYHVMDPENGMSGCGEFGAGRLPELQRIVQEVIREVTSQDLRGKKVLITAGATREYLDPVRFLSNASSGKMALVLAREAYFRGAEVTVIKGFTEVPFDDFAGKNFKVIPVTSAGDMMQKSLSLILHHDIFLCPAAISDYTPLHTSPQKMKKGRKHISVELEPAPDVLEAASRLKKRPFTVGFALEDSFDLGKARKKLKKKKADMLILTVPETLGSDHIQACIVRLSEVKHCAHQSKEILSKAIFDLVVKGF